MDDLLDLFDEEQDDKAQSTVATTGTTKNSNNGTGGPRENGRHQDKKRQQRTSRPSSTSVPSLIPSSTTSSSSLSYSSNSVVEASIDTKLGIRMVKRNISSTELIQIISSQPHHSPAALAAMSRLALNQLLIEPSSIVDDATVQGPMNIVTVGIVFTNSGTRISSNGRAFSLVTIGNLATGPVATVFLFGEAYGEYCRKCPPGKVVAIVGPSLVPPKNNGKSDTSVALSVRDRRQLLVVANAQDFGTCKGKAGYRGPDGKWHEGGRCKHHVDTRISEYCPKHRKQQHQGGSSASVKQETGLERLQRFHKESRIARGFRPAPKQLVQQGISTMPGVPLRPPQQQNQSLSRNPYLKQAPMHMKKGRASLAPVGGRGTTAQPKGAPLSKWLPGAKNSSSKPQKGGQTISGSNNNGKSIGIGSSVGAVKKRKRINTDGCGFDGSVIVPKAHKLFRGSVSQSTQQEQQQSNEDRLKTAAEENEARIRNQQRTLAASLADATRTTYRERVLANSKRNPVGSKVKTNRNKDNTIVHPKSNMNSASSTPSASSSLASFGKFENVNVAEVMEAKSRFASEVDAENYARNRKKICELERREDISTNQQQRTQKQQQQQKQTAISKVWTCQTCQRTTTTRPSLCIRQQHKVRLVREVRSDNSKAEKRMRMHKSTVQNGGMVLGAGLEWSGFRHNED